VDPDTGEATDSLQPQVIKFLKDMGSDECTTVSHVIKMKNKVVFEFIQNAIDHYNKTKAFSDALKVMSAQLLLHKDHYLIN